ncbi:MAG: DNA polymerase IV [Sphaerochaetaceae bacterium]
MAEKVWFHVDMDAFYAGVEQLDNPALRGKPVIVGGLGNRGVVSACSYEARAYKVHSAMPMYRARQLCPHGIYVCPRMERYSAVSHQVIALLKEFSPTVQQISIDEAFLDMTGTARLYGKPRQAAVLLKNRVKSEIGLTISVGIGTSRFIAKMASGYDKPDGLCRVSVGNEERFIDAIGLKKLFGIGEATLKALKHHSINKPEQLRKFSLEHLKSLFGEATGEYLYKACRGLDPGIHSGVTKSRSISTENTFACDISDEKELFQHLLNMSHEVMFRALQENLSSSTVAVKVRFSDFTTVSAQNSQGTPLCSGEQVYEIAKELLKSRWRAPQKVRLLGVGLYGVNEGSSLVQPELFEDPYQRKGELEKAVLALRSKGRNIQKASLLEPLDK